MPELRISTEKVCALIETAREVAGLSAASSLFRRKDAVNATARSTTAARARAIRPM